MKYLKFSALFLIICASISCSTNKTKPSAVVDTKSTQDISQTKNSGFYTIFFDTNSSKLSEESTSYLTSSFLPMIKTAANGKKFAIKIEGHCDERGSSLYNKSLGKKRAEAVKTFIAKQAGKSVKIEMVSYGESHPVALGHDEDSWSKNRRAVVISIK